MQRRFRAVDAGFIALVLAWRGHPSPELDMKRFPTPSLLAVALIGAFAAGGAWAQKAVQLGHAKAATKDAYRTAEAEAEVARAQDGKRAGQGKGGYERVRYGGRRIDTKTKYDNQRHM